MSHLGVQLSLCWYGLPCIALRHPRLDHAVEGATMQQQLVSLVPLDPARPTADPRSSLNRIMPVSAQLLR